MALDWLHKITTETDYIRLLWLLLDHPIKLNDSAYIISDFSTVQ